VGLLAGENDMALLQKSGVGRDINRHHYSTQEIQDQLQRPVVQRLCELIRLRNSHPAFSGRFELLDSPDTTLHLQWTQGTARATLHVDLATGRHRIETAG
jgi:sucrose phosphorylase